MREKANGDIRKYCRKKGIYLYEVGSIFFDVSADASISRKLRKELSPSEKERFIEIVDNLAEQTKGNV